MVGILLVATIAIFLAADWVKRRRGAVEETITPLDIAPGLHVLPSLPPEGYSVHRGHLWTRTEREGAYRIGMDSLISHLLGKVDRVQLPAVGSQVREGDTIARLLQGTKVLTLKAPMDGVITAINSNLRLGDLRAKPYTDGWLCEVRGGAVEISDPDFLSMVEVSDWYLAEFRRAAEFFSALPRLARPLVIDTHTGVPILASAMEALEESDWERFQQSFLHGR